MPGRESIRLISPVFQPALRMAFTHQNEKINSTGDDEKPFIIYHIPLIKFDCRVIFHFKKNRSMTYFKGIGVWGFFLIKKNLSNFYTIISQ